MKRLFGSVVDIRKGEYAITALMFLIYFMLLVTYYFLKPARDSLFLVKVDPKLLPVVFIITALVTVPVIALYNRAGRMLTLNRLINVSYLFIIVNLFGLWWLIHRDDPWVYYLFYTWVSIYGALTTSQFWLLANTIFDSAQAKRIFVLLGLGGIIGAFSGGEITGIIVKSFGIPTQHLLFFCMGFLGVCLLLVNLTWSLKKRRDAAFVSLPRPGRKSGESIGKLCKSVFRSRHLMLTVGMIALTMMVASFVDYQFKIISRESFTETADLTAFLGTFYGRLSLVSFFLQFFLAQRLLRFIGVGRVIMFLPIGLLLGSAAMFVMPGLIAAVLLRGTDGAIKYSLDKTSRELLFLPIPPEIKKRTKLFIDLFVDRWFRGFAGALLLLCTLVFDMSIAQLSLVVIAMIVVWLALTLLMRKEYVNSFRRAVEKREIDLDDIKTHINDVSTVNTLIISLGSANERQVVYALDMLQSVKDIDLVEPTIPLLRHSSAEVRLKALELLNLQGTIAQAGEVENLLDDDNMDIRQQAVRFLCRTSDDAAAKLKELLTASDRRIQYAAIACLAKDGEIPADPTMVINIVTQVLDDKSAGAEEGRIQVAMLLGYHSIPNSDEYLERLLGDSSVHVVIEAMNSLGRLGNRRHVPWLLDKLPDRRFRAQAVASLACYGASILGTLNDHLRDSHVLFSIRKTIPRIMSRIPVQETVSALTRNLEQVEPPLKFYVVKALNNLRSKYSHLKFDAEVFKTATINEMKEYYEIFQVLQLQDVSDSGPSSLLLRRALDERLQQNLERVFRLLGLVYPPRDIYNAYHGVVSGKRILQANAVEFLDNLLNPDVKKCILPMLDDVAAETVLRKANELFQLNRTTREEGHVYLIGGSDTWLRCCAIYDAADSESQEVCDLVKTATHDPDPMVRETATMTLALK